MSRCAFICILIGFIGGGILCEAARAAPTYAGPYEAQVIRVIDGDTAVMGVAVWPGLTVTTSLRVDGVNTPEKRSKQQCEKAAGRDASAFAAKFLAEGKRVEVTNIKNGKYAGRVLGDIEVDGRKLSEALLASGHARPYHGEKRGPWCEDEL